MTLMSRLSGTRTLGRRLAAALIALMTLQGCAQQLSLPIGAVNANDECSVFRGDIAEARRSDWQNQAAAAAAGAILGGIAGALLGGTEGAFLGVAGGALAGLSASYLNTRARDAADNEALLATVNSDAGADVAVVTAAGRAAQSLRQCRIDQLNDLRTAIADGTLEEAEARDRLATIQGRTAQDNRIISEAFNGVDERVTAYVEATDEVARIDAAITEREARRQTANIERVRETRTASLRADDVALERIELLSAEIDALLG